MLKKNNSTDQQSFKNFSSKVDFKLPNGYLEFLKDSNGAEGQLKNSYLVLWPIEELFSLNEEYKVDTYAPGFFLIGSDGGDTAFAIDKQTGELFEMPFIGMSREDAVLRGKDFQSFLDVL